MDSSELLDVMQWIEKGNHQQLINDDINKANSWDCRLSGVDECIFCCLAGCSTTVRSICYESHLVQRGWVYKPTKLNVYILYFKEYKVGDIRDGYQPLVGALRVYIA